MKLVGINQAVKLTLEALGIRQRSYFMVFRSPAGREVLQDLAKFCRAHKAPWGMTPEDTARLVGRNEVFQRIMDHLRLTPEEMYHAYGGKYPITAVKEEDEDG